MLSASTYVGGGDGDAMVLPPCERLPLLLVIVGERVASGNAICARHNLS